MLARGPAEQLSVVVRAHTQQPPGWARHQRQHNASATPARLATHNCHTLAGYTVEKSERSSPWRHKRYHKKPWRAVLAQG
eukprot:2941345-Alexandrium_andersonii.AAC.1